MKTASLLFGLAACASQPSKPAEPAYPLCDRAGAPACGNIGQVGRTAQPPTPVATLVTPVVQGAHTAARIVPVATRVLVQASAAIVQGQPVFARPLVDNRENIVCGNVMNKGGSRRVCRDATTGRVLSAVAVDNAEGEGY